MNKNILKALLFIFYFISLTLQADKLEHISLQLKWKYQFQFAGFIMAKEKGFYKDVGLDVELIEFHDGIDMIRDLKIGKTDYSISDSALIFEALSGTPVVAMMANFQDSPYILMGLKSSNIKTLDDINGKKLALYSDIDGITLDAMLKSHKINFIEKPLIFKLDKLISGEIDMMTAYLSNEPFIAKEMGYEIISFNPNDYGFEGYGDILFTTKEKLKNSPQQVDKMYEASKKGWEYAYTHIDETVDILYKKYNTLNKSKKALLFEANALKKISGYGEDFGLITPAKVKGIAHLFSFMFYGKKDLSILDDFIYSPALKNYTYLHGKHKWMVLNHSIEIDLTFIIQLIGIVLTILLIILYWNMKLKREIKKREVLENKLKNLNLKLKSMVSDGIKEIHSKEKLLLSQSRAAQMGEMISMIAHQWRQPLSAISAGLIVLKTKLALKKFNFDIKSDRDDFISLLNEKSNDITRYVKYLSQTIDDFRNFYAIDKDENFISLELPIKNALKLIDASIKSHNINLHTSYEDNLKIYLYTNEITQVILNILKNSEDNFIENNIENPYINITTKKEDDKYIILICDNGGGIKEDIIEDIFNPYFSTKTNKNGTGLGLYMSKMIIQRHNEGKLFAYNSDDGVCFKISITGEHIKDAKD